MAQTNFMRRYILECGKMGEEGFQVGNVDGARQTALHIAFNIEKSDTESSNDSTIQIWNLSDANIKALDKKDIVVRLKAGYENNIALLFVGTVSSVSTSLDGADRVTEIKAVDGRVELRDTDISISFNGKVDCKTIYNYISENTGLPIEYGENLEFASIPNGFSFVGKAKNALAKVATTCKHSWTIQNGVIQVTNPGKGLAPTGLLLSSETGLISLPRRITLSSNTDKDKEPETGWEVSFFLNGAVGVNDVIRVESKAVSGYFRVKSVSFSGDNFTGDWIATAQLIEIPSKE